jgi:futalosine hydrolase
MSLRILYVTATSAEAEALKKIPGLSYISDRYFFRDIEINLLIAGIGSVATVWAVKNWISIHGKPDLAINAGIAGSYKPEYGIGSVVNPVSDCFADAGIEDRDTFLTISESGLTAPDEFPFKKGFLLSGDEYSTPIKNIFCKVRAITVNTATGSELTKNKWLNKFNPDIETMEGAAFFYICAMENIPFLALRAVSNMVEPRDKTKWEIGVALRSLSEKLGEVLIRLD